MANNKSPIFKKTFRKETIILEDNNRTKMNNHKLLKAFNTFFSNITQNKKSMKTTQISPK